VRVLESGQLAGYAGMSGIRNQHQPIIHGARCYSTGCPHISGTSLSAQTRYAAGTRGILECWFEDRPTRDEYLIAKEGKLAGVGAHSYSVREPVKS